VTGKTCLMKNITGYLEGKNNFQLPDWKFIADVFFIILLHKCLKGKNKVICCMEMIGEK
jgi:hypothetical protein